MVHRGSPLLSCIVERIVSQDRQVTMARSFLPCACHHEKQSGQRTAMPWLYVEKSGQRRVMTWQRDRMMKPAVQLLVLYHLQIEDKNNFSDNNVMQ